MATDFGKMVGPLPLGAWVAVVGGGLAFAIYTRRQSDANPPADSNVLTPEDGSGIAGVGDGSVGGFIPTTPSGDGSITQGAPQSNEEWGSRAINWLIAQGYSSAVSDSAIRKYLDQERGYSAQEFSLVTIALAHLGSPPVPLPAPVFGKPQPHHKPPPKPPVHRGHHGHGGQHPEFRYHTIRPGDSLYGLAKRYYHRGDQWRLIAHANNAGQKRADGSPGFIRSNDIHHLGRYIGRRLIIPR